MSAIPRDETVRRIVSSGIIAIIRSDEAKGLDQVADALAAGGVEAIEFTMTTPGALKVLEECAGRDEGARLFGAGTVLDAETARAAILAGARFLVAPTFNPAVISMAHRYDVAVLPGALTPTEMLAAFEAGADLVKLFPATALGPQYVKDVLAPLPQLRLVPVGGVSLDNVTAFIRAGAAAVGVGSNLVDRQCVREGRWVELTEKARRYSEAVQQARGVHIHE